MYYSYVCLPLYPCGCRVYDLACITLCNFHTRMSFNHCDCVIIIMVQVQFLESRRHSIVHSEAITCELSIVCEELVFTYQIWGYIIRFVKYMVNNYVKGNIIHVYRSMSCAKLWIEKAERRISRWQWQTLSQILDQHLCMTLMLC